MEGVGPCQGPETANSLAGCRDLIFLSQVDQMLPLPIHMLLLFLYRLGSQIHNDIPDCNGFLGSLCMHP